MRVAIIGAGPSGLVTLKYLLAAERALGTKPVEVRLFESEASVGGTFLARTYEDAELVSSRQLTCFSDFRCRDDEPDFISAKRYVEYLKEYCTNFNLWPHMTFSCRVTKVESRREGGHAVTYLCETQQYTWDCDAVAVCSGLHVNPSIPQIKGIEKIPLVLHSSQLKRRDQFGVGKSVLILGSGETGADVSLLAVTSPTKRVVLCHRNGFHLAPKRNPNPRLIFARRRNPLDRPQVPIDVSRASLFDTIYVHPWLRNSSLLWVYYDYYVRWILWTSWGTTHGTDQWVGGKPKGWTTSEIKTPNTLASTKGRKIDLAPWPDRIDDTGAVVFKDNGRPEYALMKDEVIKPDVVILCTGYTYEFPFLGKDRCNPQHYEGKLVRDIWPRDDPSIGFIGFVRPNLGAIPPLTEFQAQLWVLNLLAPGKVVRSPLLPEDEGHYRLVCKTHARIRYGVDHESYAYQLALDMGSAPSFGEILRLGFSSRAIEKDDNTNSNVGSWYKLPLTWALGANFNTKFRLLGPWKWDGAVQVMNTELWDTVARRQMFFGHITVSIFPMLIFGPVSLAVFLYASLYRLLQVLGRSLRATAIWASQINFG
ncbi:FAD/NAD(P)-binding domain-containing protein [Jackrogersella minutella]|nr:FAD/NAD(P)-binding domain-containing protein [Jackrogersella minutella]